MGVDEGISLPPKSLESPSNHGSQLYSCWCYFPILLLFLWRREPVVVETRPIWHGCSSSRAPVIGWDKAHHWCQWAHCFCLRGLCHMGRKETMATWLGWSWAQHNWLELETLICQGFWFPPEKSIIQRDMNNINPWVLRKMLLNLF